MENWVTVASGLVAYRAAKAAMGYGNKRKFALTGPLQPSVSGNFVGKKGFKRRKVYRPRPSAGLYMKNRYGQQNDMNSHFCTLTDSPEQIGIASMTTRFGMVVPSMLQACPSWAYWSGLYHRYKIEWVKIQFNCQANTIVLHSCVSMDSTTLHTDLDDVLKQPSVRTHQVHDNSPIPASRTLKLFGAQAWKDYLDCDSANADIGTYTANGQTQTGGTHKFGIHYAMQSSGGGHAFPTIKFGVRFRGLRDTVNMS